MMDELEMLKKDWQRKEEQLPKLTYDEIYSMIWKKSSSIVKWIFIISVLEFLLPHLLYLLPSAREGMDFYEGLHLKNLMIGLTIVQYAVVIYFIYQFYRRYKEISALDSAKELMRKIIRTRKTVKNYIIFALSFFLITFLFLAIGIYLNDSETIISALDLQNKQQDLSSSNIKSIFVVVLVAFGIVCTALLGLVYYLIYGFLLRKLSRNFNELERLEV